MAWICKNCKHINANLMNECYYCIHHFGVKCLKDGIFSIIDEIDISNTKYEIWKTEQVELGNRIAEQSKMSLTLDEINNNPNMNEREKKFARFFALEKTLISSMDDSALRAHIEELQDIAYEARARLTASNDEAMERSAKKKKDKGFSTSVATDDFTSEAINNISDRQKKMSKVEKEVERLVALGIDRKDAENMYRATTVNAIKKGNLDAVVKDVSGKVSIESIVNSVVNAGAEEKKAFSNPFAPKVEGVKFAEETKKEEVKQVLDSPKSEIEEVKQQEEIKPKFTNPFEKK